MTRRISKFFGFAGNNPGVGSQSPISHASSPGNTTDISETGSVTSEITGSIAGSETFFDRRRSFGISLRLSSDPNEEEVDNLMRGLYLDTDLLEKKCQYSALGMVYDENGIVGSGEKKEKASPKKLYQTRSLESLSPLYFDPECDPVNEIITRVSHWDKDVINDEFMNNIELADGDKDVVSSHLAYKIEQNFSGLLESMKSVHAIDIDLARAIIQISGSRRRLKSSIESISGGPLRACKAKIRRDQLEMVQEAAKSLKIVKDLFDAMIKCITTGELGRAAHFARSVTRAVTCEPFCRFSALSSILENTSRNIVLIRQKTDKAVLRICGRKFSFSEYSQHMLSYLILDELKEVHHINFVDPLNLGDMTSFEAELGCVEGLAGRVQKYQREDIDSYLHKAVVEIIYAGQHRKQIVAQSIDIAGAGYSTMNMAEIMELAEVDLSSLYQRLTADLIAPCFVRVCEVLTDIIYTNYLIVQWHRAPFDDNNENPSSLHQLWTENDEEVSFGGMDESLESNELFKLSMSSCSGKFCGNFADSVDDFRRSEEHNRLKEVFLSLLRDREVLWDELLQALVTLLHSVSLTSFVTLEDFIAIVWAVDVIMALGEEFCRSSSAPLRICLEEKTKEYFYHVHSECFHIYRQMLQSDPWTSVPIDISEYGNINNLINSKVLIAKNDANSLLKLVSNFEIKEGCLKSRFEFLKGETSSNVGRKSSVFSFVFQHGNPFHFLGTEEKESKDSSANTAPVTSSSPANDSVFDLSSLINTIFEDNLSNQNSQNKRNQAMNDVFVMTQSLLNGLAKYTGKYLQFMSLSPFLAVDVFHSLCQLFDFYLSFVFHGFVSTEERTKFLAKAAKLTLSAPQLSMEYEAFKSFFEKAMNETVQTGFSSKEYNEESVSNNGSENSNAPISVETQKLSEMMRDIDSIDLNDSSECFGLIYRIVAAESCWFAARIFQDMKSKIIRCLPERYRDQCDQYGSQYQIVAGQLRSLIYKCSCPQLIRQSWLLTQIAETSGWDSKKTRDTHHEWIEKTCNHCKEAWDFIMSGEYFGKSTSIVREQIWMDICQCAFDCLLEGFSKIRKVSSEGRGSMIMDVLALHEGLDSIHPCRIPRGKIHLEAYIRAGLMSEEDMMTWVHDNYEAYAYRHMLGLLTQTLSSVLNSKRLKDAQAVLDSLYESQESTLVVNNGLDSENKLSSLLSNRLKEDGGFTGMISSRLRRQSILGGSGGGS